jgi:hypothetical protein
MVLGGQSTGVIVGRVVARAPVEAPVPLAAVEVPAAALRTLTDTSGSFTLDGVPAGRLVLRVGVIGYATAERTVRVRGGDTVVLRIVLDRAVLITPMVVTARADEVELFESRPNVGTVALTAARMAGVPKIGEADVVRVVQLLPGVISRNDFNTGLNVRGGEADQNLILLDGFPIYNPFHVGGLFSTFMDATVGAIELSTAAFPARFGGRLSSVLDVRSSEDPRPGVSAIVDVSALGATAKLGGSLRDRGSWNVAARRTYADAATSLFTENIFPYHFRDFHARGTYVLPADWRLAVTGYAGDDVLDADLAEFETDSVPTRAGAGTWRFEWGNRVVGATLAKDVGRIGFEQSVSASSFSTVLDLGDGALTQRNSIREVRAKGAVVAHTVSHDLSGGYEAATHRIRYSSGSTQTASSSYNMSQSPTVLALWLEDLWRSPSKWLIQTGLRAEWLSEAQWIGISPRLAVKYFVTPDVAVTAAAGRVTQWLHSLAGDGPLRYFEIWLASDSLTPVAAAWHGAAGVERRFGSHASVKLEGYLKRYDRVLDANASEDPQLRGDELLPADGVSYGLDALARWSRSPRVDGWLAYSYALSSRSRDGTRWWPGHDRRHDLDVVATWRLSKYRVGSRFGFASGAPYTPILGEVARRVYDPSRDRWGTGDAPIRRESLGGGRNSARFPATHRLDLDVSRDFIVRGALVAPYVSVVNAYGARNVFVYLYEYSTDQPTRRAISQFPILPSLGVRVAF